VRHKLDKGFVLEYIFIIMLLVILFLGFYGTSMNFEGDPEYIIGILIASSIVFGFWAVLIEKEPTDTTKKFFYKHAISIGVYVSLAFLFASVITIFFNALNKLPYIVTLWFCTMSFMFNVFLLIMTLHYYKFKE
jgi:hypothetical protein